MYILIKITIELCFIHLSLGEGFTFYFLVGIMLKYSRAVQAHRKKGFDLTDKFVHLTLARKKLGRALILFKKALSLQIKLHFRLFMLVAICCYLSICLTPV